MVFLCEVLNFSLQFEGSNAEIISAATALLMTASLKQNLHPAIVKSAPFQSLLQSILANSLDVRLTAETVSLLIVND